MIINPTVSKLCTVSNACEWIAFGWKPVAPIYKYTDGKFINEDGKIDRNYKTGYLQAMKIVSYKLLVAIYERRLAAIGFKDVEGSKEIEDFKPLRVKVNDCSEINFSNEGIECPLMKYNYRFVIMNFKSVQKCFPRDENGNPIEEPVKETKQQKREYNSLYMDIMNSVVKDLCITEKNQPSKKSIYFHVLDKYTKKYNLSNNTVQMISSLVLNPESRLGKAKK